MIAAAALSALSVLFLVAWWLERRDRTTTHTQQLAVAERERVRQQQDHKRERAEHAQAAARERTDLLDRFATEREQWANERAVLLNRIKPETAQPVLTGEIVAPPAVPMDDDPAFWESKELLAERQWQAEVSSSQ